MFKTCLNRTTLRSALLGGGLLLIGAQIIASKGWAQTEKGAEKGVVKFVVYLAGGPGDSLAAEKPLGSIMEKIALGAGFAPQSHAIEGKYFPHWELATGYIKTQSPTLFLLPAEAFFENEKALGLEALAQTAMGTQTAQVLTLIVRTQSSLELTGIAGKVISTSLLEDGNLAHLVALKNGQHLGQIAQLRYERSPLASLRQLRSGEVFAVLLDEAQMKGLDKLPFANEFKVLTQTQSIPRPIIAVSSKAGAELKARLKKGVLTLGGVSEIKPQLAQFSVDNIVEASAKQLTESRTLYAAGKKALKKK